jgi:LysR family hca operon transcriptional activator
MSDTAPVLQKIIDAYLTREGLDLKPAHRVDNLGMAMSLVASTRGVALLPAYATNFLPWSVVSRPISGQGAFIDLVAGYSTANKSPVLKTFLAQIDDLIARVGQRHAV